MILRWKWPRISLLSLCALVISRVCRRHVKVHLAPQTRDTRSTPPPTTSTIGGYGRSIVSQWALRPGTLTIRLPQGATSWQSSVRWCACLTPCCISPEPGNQDQTATRRSSPRLLSESCLECSESFRRNHINVVPLRSLNLTVNGLMRDCVAANGPRSPVPKRREPMTNGLIHSLVSLPACTPLGSQGQLKWDDLQGKYTRLAICMADVTGLRNVELFQSNNESYVLQLTNISWRIKGVDITSPVTVAQLLSLSPGGFMVITPGPSHAD